MTGPLPYADITNPQSLNKYAYALNNPVRYNDPNGHCLWDICVAETALVVSAAVYTTAYFTVGPGKQQLQDFTYAVSALGADAIRNLSMSESNKDEGGGEDSDDTFEVAGRQSTATPLLDSLAEVDVAKYGLTLKTRLTETDRSRFNVERENRKTLSSTIRRREKSRAPAKPSPRRKIESPTRN